MSGRFQRFPFSLSMTARSELSGSGFTLMEVMLSLAIGTIGILLFSSALLNSENSFRGMQTSATRDDLRLMVRNNIRDRNAFKITIDRNPALKAIVTGDFSGPVDSILSGVQYGLTLYDSSGRPLSNPLDANPGTVFYTTDGFPCQNLNEPKCRFSISSYFLIQGRAEWGTYHNMIPIRKFPWGPFGIKPEFLIVCFSITFLNSSNTMIDLKPYSSMIFVSFDDLSNEEMK